MALLGSLLGAAFFTFGMLSATGAPQEAAVAAAAVALAVLPYVLARSWDEITRPKPVGPNAPV